jgi:hypothetical protein
MAAKSPIICIRTITQQTCVLVVALLELVCSCLGRHVGAQSLQAFAMRHILEHM